MNDGDLPPPSAAAAAAAVSGDGEETAEAEKVAGEEKREKRCCGGDGEAEKVAGEEKKEKRCCGGDGEADADADADAEEVAGEENEEERCGSAGDGDAAEGSGEALGRAIAAALGGVMREFDARAEGAARSQGELTLSLDRLTGELDKLLEDVPSPFIMQHAAKISSIRKRVAALNFLLRSVQRRIDNIDRILSTGVQSDTRPPETVETSTLTL